MNTIISTVKEALPSLAQMEDGINTFFDKGIHMSNMEQPWLIAVIVLGVIACFFGLQFVKLWTTLLGLAIGGVAGYAAGLAFGATELISLAVGAVLGIIIAVLALNLYRVGCFLLCLVLGTSISYALLQPQSIPFFAICLLIGLVTAVISIKLTDPMVVVESTVAGALAVGMAAVQMLDMTGKYFEFIIAGVLFVIGMALQFLYASKKVNRREIAKAGKIKEAESVENDIEAARAILDQPEEEIVFAKEKEESVQIKTHEEEERKAQEIIEETTQELKEDGKITDEPSLEFPDEVLDELKENESISEEIETEPAVEEEPAAEEEPQEPEAKTGVEAEEEQFNGEDDVTKARRELEEARQELEKLKQELEEAKKGSNA